MPLWSWQLRAPERRNHAYLCERNGSDSNCQPIDMDRLEDANSAEAEPKEQ